MNSPERSTEGIESSPAGIAIELHIVARATDYLESEGILPTVETPYGSRERKAALLAEVRRRDRNIFKMLEEIDVLDDPVGALQKDRHTPGSG